MLLPPDSSDVVIVAGMPGAGKTTLTRAEPRALDSDALRERLRTRLGLLPYTLWRPLVHGWHWLAIWRAAGRPEGVVLVRPFSTPWLRRLVLRRALRHHRAVHLVLVEVTPRQARAGQRERGRVIRERAMRRHERRWADADLAGEPWTTVTRLRRGDAAPVLGRAPAQPACRRVTRRCRCATETVITRPSASSSRVVGRSSSGASSVTM